MKNEEILRTAIMLGPLIYAIHHFEEHIIFNFREWRTSYFSDNNSITTEAILNKAYLTSSDYDLRSPIKE